MNNIQENMDFAWYVSKVLRRSNRIISKLKSKYWRKTHKFGIRFPKTVKEALWTDKENGNNYWEKAQIRI